MRVLTSSLISVGQGRLLPNGQRSKFSITWIYLSGLLILSADLTLRYCCQGNDRGCSIWGGTGSKAVFNQAISLTSWRVLGEETAQVCSPES
jgi:hypothetical protein